MKGEDRIEGEGKGFWNALGNPKYSPALSPVPIPAPRPLWDEAAWVSNCVGSTAGTLLVLSNCVGSKAGTLLVMSHMLLEN